jgi:hypothetical protein
MKNHSIEFLCSGCALRLRAKQSALGKHLKCPKCFAVVLVKKELQNDPEVLENFNFGYYQIQNENQVIEHNDLLKSHLIFNKKNKTDIPENIQSASSTEINIQKIKNHTVSNNTATEKPNQTLAGSLFLIFLAGSLIVGFFMYDHYQTKLKESNDKNKILVKNDAENNLKLAEIDKKLVQIREDNEIKHAQRVAEKAAEKEMELVAEKKKAIEKEMELEAEKKKAVERKIVLEATRKRIDEKEKAISDIELKKSVDLQNKQRQYEFRVSSNKKRGVVTLTSLADVRVICENPSEYVGLTAYLPACYVKAENISRNSTVNGHLFSFTTGDNLSNLETFGNSIFIQKYNLNFGMGSKIADDFKALNYLRRTRIEIALSGIQDRLSVPIRDTFKWKYATMNMKFYVKELSSDTYIAELLTLFVSE